MSDFVSHSQAGQDVFAYEQSGKKTNGRFLDIGCNDAVHHSNTYGLEQIGWTGLRVDIADYSAGRSSRFLLADATTSHPEILEFCQTPVDYLSVDIDTMAGSYTRLAMEWLHRLTFGVVTVEHDAYRLGPQSRDYIRLLMSTHYDLLYPDVVAPGYGAFEDWFRHKHYQP